VRAKKMRCRFLGINGFEFIAGNRTLLLDPYVSRTRGGMRAVSVPETVREHITCADYIVLSHSHYDHLGDVPEICKHTRASVCGSKTTLNICRFFGMEEDSLFQFVSRTPMELGPFRVTPLPSLHKTPMKTPGVYDRIPGSIHATGDFREGGTWALLIEVEGHSILDIGSANFAEEELRGIECDYLIAAIAGRGADFVPRLLDSVRAKHLIPSHWDDFRSTPIEDPGESYSLDEFRREVHASKPGQDVMVVRVLETFTTGL